MEAGAGGAKLSERQFHQLPRCHLVEVTTTGADETGAMSMNFGIHNPSWVYGPDPAEAFEGVKAKAQWAENHGFVWFSGAGNFETECRQYGWEFPPRPAVRIRQMEEAVRLILALWTQRRTTFHGRYFHAEGAILEPEPFQKPRPPVMIAGGGEQLTLRAVAAWPTPATSAATRK
jgi:hypothetical protein